MATPSPKRVALLGYGGLLPFIGLSIGSVVDHHHALIWVDALHAYGAVILSFVGALHWGFAMLANDLDDAERDARYLWSVIPALLAWPALLLSGPVGQWHAGARFCAALLAGSSAGQRLCAAALVLAFARATDRRGVPVSDRQRTCELNERCTA
jgi:hypothetical protein